MLVFRYVFVAKKRTFLTWKIQWIQLISVLFCFLSDVLKKVWMKNRLEKLWVQTYFLIKGSVMQQLLLWLQHAFISSATVTRHMSLAHERVIWGSGGAATKIPLWKKWKEIEFVTLNEEALQKLRHLWVVQIQKRLELPSSWYLCNKFLEISAKARNGVFACVYLCARVYVSVCVCVHVACVWMSVFAYSSDLGTTEAKVAKISEHNKDYGVTLSTYTHDNQWRGL